MNERHPADRPPTGVCGVCDGEIEWVPTPEGANPIWHTPYWRHTSADPRPHAARPSAIRLPLGEGNSGPGGAL